MKKNKTSTMVYQCLAPPFKIENLHLEQRKQKLIFEVAEKIYELSLVSLLEPSEKRHVFDVAMFD